MATRRKTKGHRFDRPVANSSLIVEMLATGAEVDVLLAMMQAGRHATLSGVVRVALWNYAKHLGINVPIDVFKA